MFLLLALVFAVGAALCFYLFQSTETETSNPLFLVLGVLFVILTAVCGVLFLSKRVNKGEDIHITE